MKNSPRLSWPYRLALIVGTLVILACLGLLLPIEVAFQLAFGWIWFLLRVVPRVQLSAGALASATLFGLGFSLGVHLLGRWLGNHARSPWSFRKTASLTLLVLLSFTTGVAVVGIVHQSVWLAQGRWVEDQRTANLGLHMRAKLSSLRGTMTSGDETWQQVSASLLRDPGLSDPERLRWLVFPDSLGHAGLVMVFPRSVAELEQYGGFHFTGSQFEYFEAAELPQLITAGRDLADGLASNTADSDAR